MKANPDLAKSIITRKSNSAEVHFVITFFFIICTTFGFDDRTVFAADPSDGGSPVKALTVHWDGTVWTYVPNPTLQTDYAFLKNVTALASNDVWAAGYFTDSTGTDRNLLEHWDGIAWTQIDVPEMLQSHNQLWGIVPDRAGGLWTVGSFLPTDFSRPLSSLVLHGSP